MEEKKDLQSCELSDETLDAASGGTDAQTAELMQLTGLDEDHLFDALSEGGVGFMMLASGNNLGNVYFDRNGGGAISHEELVARLNQYIMQYKLTHPFDRNGPFK